jgi:hypothetical protein
LDPAVKNEHKHVGVTSEDATYVLGSVDNVLVALTRQPPTVDSVRRFADHAESLSQRYPDGIAILIIPRAPKPALGPGVPRAVLAAWRRLEPVLICSAVLIRSTGVVGALQRGLVSPLLNVRPGSSPVKLSANPYDAAEWIARHASRHEGAALPLGRAFAAFLEEHEGPVSSRAP